MRKLLALAALAMLACQVHKAVDDIATETQPNARLVTMMNEAIETELKTLRELPATCGQCKATAAPAFDAYLHAIAETALWCELGKSHDKHNLKNVRVRSRSGTSADLHAYQRCKGTESLFRITFADGRATGVFTDGAEKGSGPETMLATLREVIATLKNHDIEIHRDAYVLSEHDPKRKTDEARR